jgi:predicted metalloprotease with PDZ domain
MSRNEARKTVTAEDASWRVWESGDSQGFGGLSYYDKGELIGLCLDLKIRAVTDGKKSLDDVMRLLMKRHAPPLPGYAEDELRLTVNEVAGQDISDLYNLIVRSTAVMPFADLLAPFGLDISFKPLLTETPAQRSLRDGWLEGTKQ